MNGIFLVRRRCKLHYFLLAVFFPVELVGVLFLVVVEMVVALPIVVIRCGLFVEFPVGVA